MTATATQMRSAVAVTPSARTAHDSNAWAAQSQTGGNLILTGEAEAGGRVFYEQHTNRITGRAPDLAVTDLPLV